ncbi:MAG: hypothetical protein J5636_01610 [Clostridiales bacterium]|nr:hypothetical protein [Clostridiales bacterium]
MKKAFKIILCSILAVILIVAGFCIYGAWDYTRRCVKITPKNHISTIEVGKEYSIEDFFLIEREKNTDGRVIAVCWADGSSDNISVDENGHFVVSEGSGSLTISLSDRNHNSPEAADGSVKVLVG